LEYSRASANPIRWVLAVPDESPVTKPEDLAGKIVATELVKTTRRYFESRNIPVTVEFSWGTTEIKARLLDGIVDCTETGSSLKANNLRIVDTPAQSTDPLRRIQVRLGRPAESARRWKTSPCFSAGAIEARAKVGLKMNVPEAKLAEVVGFLPAEKARPSAAWPTRRGLPLRSSSKRSRSAS
jgi:ATP phosphoribosyltransferase